VRKAPLRFRVPMPLHLPSQELAEERVVLIRRRGTGAPFEEVTLARQPLQPVACVLPFRERPRHLGREAGEIRRGQPQVAQFRRRAFEHLVARYSNRASGARSGRRDAAVCSQHQAKPAAQPPVRSQVRARSSSRRLELATGEFLDVEPQSSSRGAQVGA
jgi:hypothetical protein